MTFIKSYRPSGRLPHYVCPLGETVRDCATSIVGTLIARTEWHDRSAECAILRLGTDADGKPFDIHWFPASRMGPVT